MHKACRIALVPVKIVVLPFICVGYSLYCCFICGRYHFGDGKPVGGYCGNGHASALQHWKHEKQRKKEARKQSRFWEASQCRNRVPHTHAGQNDAKELDQSERTASVQPAARAASSLTVVSTTGEMDSITQDTISRPDDPKATSHTEQPP